MGMIIIRQSSWLILRIIRMTPRQERERKRFRPQEPTGAGGATCLYLISRKNSTYPENKFARKRAYLRLTTNELNDLALKEVKFEIFKGIRRSSLVVNGPALTKINDALK